MFPFASKNLKIGKISKEFSKSPSVDYALGLVLKEDLDIKVWNVIVSMFMYNREITANILGKFYSDKRFYKYSLRALRLFGETQEFLKSS